MQSYESPEDFRRAAEVAFSEGLLDDGPRWQDVRDRDVVSRVSSKKRPELPLTENHLRYQEAIRSHEVTFCSGPAGTGKTSLACQVAAQLIQQGRVDRVVLTRPMVTTGKGLGFLPGNIEEKIGPFLSPLVDCLREAFGDKEYEALRAGGVIEVCPLETMRGSTFHRAFVILDESSNATFEQLKMFVTRCGHGGKLVVNGDVEQSDLEGEWPPLLDVWRRLNAEPRHDGFAFVRLTEEDVLRPDIVRFAAKRLARSWEGKESGWTATSATTSTSGATEPGPRYGDGLTTALYRNVSN